MARIYFLVAFVALAAIASAAPKFDNIDVQIVEDIATFRAENPDLNIRAVAPTKGEVRYTAGKRVSGDRLVSQSNNSYTYPEHQIIQLKLNYPKSGTGAVVSFVEVVVNHDSNDGGFYIVSGGIGMRQIGVIVEAKRASFFTYRAAIYGY